MATQGSIGTPATSTAHAPQLESSQARLAPVRPRSSRNTSKSSFAGGTGRSRVSAFTWCWINSLLFTIAFLLELRLYLNQNLPADSDPMIECGNQLIWRSSLVLLRIRGRSECRELRLAVE